jgi:hypothetical protein
VIKVKINLLTESVAFRFLKAKRCERLMETIFNDPLFAQLWREKPAGFFHGETSSLKDISGKDFFEIFATGADGYDSEHDKTINISLGFYYRRFSSAIGYTTPGSHQIFANTKFFDGFDVVDAASNLAHEYTHNMGFDHDFKNTSRRRFSVSYQMNEIFERVYFEKIASPSSVDASIDEGTHKLVCWRPWYRFGFKKCRWVKQT